MRVEFTKHDRNGRVACEWTATRAKRSTVPGSYMPAGRDIPHDLGQFVVEATVGVADGFWGMIDRGAAFRSTGRKVTKPGRAIIREHRAELDAAEVIAGTHLAEWRNAGSSPVCAALDAAMTQWSELGDGDSIAFEWPSPVGVVSHL